MVLTARDLIVMTVLLAGAGRPYQTSREDKHVRVSWSQNSRTCELDIEGELEFTDDDHDINSLSPGGP
jgi:hypothetical protein